MSVVKIRKVIELTTLLLVFSTAPRSWAKCGRFKCKVVGTVLEQNNGPVERAIVSVTLDSSLGLSQTVQLLTDGNGRFTGMVEYESWKDGNGPDGFHNCEKVPESGEVTVSRDGFKPYKEKKSVHTEEAGKMELVVDLGRIVIEGRSGAMGGGLFSALSKHPKGEFQSFADEAKLECANASRLWNWSEKELINKTENIFVGISAGSELTTNPMDVRPDVKTGGYAADYRDRNLQGKNRKWNFRVVKVLKGKIAENAISSVVTSLFEPETDKNDPAGVSALGCEELLKFSDDQYYLIFQNSYHPLGYRQLSGIKDPLIAKLVSQIRKN